ncbi:hypothetical protein IPM62_03175 [Candidatus Woesebacteria bacterium]|nr:MAG: hypothetical protein IPM62_03175 [Candidatus Woesebacteria bacterium]
MHLSKNSFSSLGFNPRPSTVMHIDLNSCFATIEQQANPFLRGKPIAVAAYASPNAVILAPSVEAKRGGVKTGMRVKDGKKICPTLKILTPDPDKYRYVHIKLRELLSPYSSCVVAKSIDEFVLDINDYVTVSGKTIYQIGGDIKKRITDEIGEWITVSIGMGPSRFIAKMASNLKKPDGLEEINKDNVEEVYSKLSLIDLHGINYHNKVRLNKVGIYSVLDFYRAEPAWLKAAFMSISCYYWYLRLRGWDIDDVEYSRKTFGNSYALPGSKGTKSELLPILQKLVEKTGSRLRKNGYRTKGVYLALLFKDGSYWHRSKNLKKIIFDSRDIYKEMINILNYCPEIKPVRIIAENVYDLIKESGLQLDLFRDIEKGLNVAKSIDSINQRWGEFSITPLRMVIARDKIPDRISFGGISELMK